MQTATAQQGQRPAVGDAHAHAAAGTAAGAHDVRELLHHLAHHLPSQAPLKDFIHHNTLHSFQTLPFHEGLAKASATLGYRTYLSLEEFRELHRKRTIRDEVLDRVLGWHLSTAEQSIWRERLISGRFDAPAGRRVGALRATWKREHHIDLDSQVHPLLFRIVNSFFDQGIAMWRFPIWDKGLLESLRELERSSMTSLFNTPRARRLLADPATRLEDLLRIVVGDERYWEQYLYDQQFAHPGWSGMVAVLEVAPVGLIDRRDASLHDLVAFELLLEIDALDRQFGEIRAPLAVKAGAPPMDVMAPVAPSDLDRALALWQEAFEWSYYDDVLAGIAAGPAP